MFCATFPWRTDEFVVRDTEWVDLSAHNSHLPYFYAQCLQPARKNSKAVAFKAKQFTLYVVVPAAQWAEYELFIAKVDCETTTADAAISEGGEDVISNEGLTSTGDQSIPFRMWYAQTTFMPARIAQPSVLSDHTEKTCAEVSNAALTIRMNPGATKWGVVSPPPTAHSPPRKIPAIEPFSSPCRTHLKEALKSGGTSELDVDKGEHIHSPGSFIFPYTDL